LTYHGFRYVEVTGFPGNLTADDISRLRMHAALEPKARASFGDEVLQAIHEGSRGAQQSNLMLVPTDCPQRDERLGWMGDASLSAESMMKHFDYADMATAYTDSMIDNMGEAGWMTDIVPSVRIHGPGDTSWSAAFIETLTQIWKIDGNIEPAEARWGAVKKYVAFIESQFLSLNSSLERWPEHYGDWCPPPHVPGGPRPTGEVASHGFSAAFSAVHSVQEAALLAKGLGNADAAHFSELAQTMTKAFHDSFYKPTSSTYDKGFMINYVLALSLGAVPQEEDAAVFQGLLAHIEAKNYTWSGGIINNRFLFDLLHDRGRADLALRMLQRRDYPSYGYMYFNDLEPAKECMWELPDAPFQGDGMNSRNHHMFSSVGSYLLRLAGLGRGTVEEELMAFVGPRGLPGASTTLQTPHGEATWSWRWVGESLDAAVTVPVGMRAKVYVPSELSLDISVESLVVRESGPHATGAFQKIVLPSGRHHFTAGRSEVSASEARVIHI